MTRPLSHVPRVLLPLLAAALMLQLAWHGACRPASQASAHLPPAPPLAALQMASLGEPIALSKLLLLATEAHDDAGTSFKTLDYVRLRDWLARALDLDPRSQAPLLAASEVYGAVADPQRARLMLDFVYQRFGEDPDRRWPWLAHAALVARHRLHDLPLARRYAQAIRTRARGKEVPVWAHELEVLILDGSGERDSARVLIGALLASGQISDPRERDFLARRLASLDTHPH